MNVVERQSGSAVSLEQDKLRSEAARIEQALTELLSSAPFRKSLQSQRLLRYIVEHTIAMEDHLLRERVIGAVIFGRPADYETGDDAVVRMRAAELRKRLAQYYQSFADPETSPEVTIDVPPGSYRATFRWRPETHTSASKPFVPAPLLPEVVVVPPSVQPESQVRSRKWIVLWGVPVFIVFALVAVWHWEVSPERRLQAFWQPWTSSSKPVIIVMGSNAVYRFSDQVMDSYASEHKLETQGEEFFLPLVPGSTVRSADLVPAWNSFVALGDVAAVSALVGNFANQHKAFQERFPNDISFAELRNDSTVLVGGFNNPMTLELTRRLPFVLKARDEIDDTTNGHRWLLHASLDSHDTEDYAVITRLVQRGGDAPILSLAGMGQYGTLASANFVCNATAVAELTRGLRKDWKTRNLQLLLHVKVVDFKPTAVEVLSVHAW